MSQPTAAATTEQAEGNPNDLVNIRLENSDGNDIAVTTREAFETVHRHKGFVIVSDEEAAEFERQQVLGGTAPQAAEVPAAPTGTGPTSRTPATGSAGAAGSSTSGVTGSGTPS